MVDGDAEDADDDPDYMSPIFKVEKSSKKKKKKEEKKKGSNEEDYSKI